MECQYKESYRELDFYVVDTDAPPVLSLKSCLGMKLIKLILAMEEVTRSDGGMTKTQLLEDYKDVFTGICLFPGEHRIKLDPEVKPVVHAERKIPIALQKRLEKELQDMQKKGVIASVEEPTEWVSSLVVVEKRESGKLRICLDPRDLNRAIRREHYPLPSSKMSKPNCQEKSSLRS